MRQNIDKTILFFLRNKEVKAEEIIKNENIRFLLRYAEADLRKNKLIAECLRRISPSKRQPWT